MDKIEQRACGCHFGLIVVYLRIIMSRFDQPRRGDTPEPLEFYSAREAGEKLGLTKKVFETMVGKGAVLSMRIGRPEPTSDTIAVPRRQSDYHHPKEYVDDAILHLKREARSRGSDTEKLQDFANASGALVADTMTGFRESVLAAPTKHGHISARYAGVLTGMDQHAIKSRGLVVPQRGVEPATLLRSVEWHHLTLPGGIVNGYGEPIEGGDNHRNF